MDTVHNLLWWTMYIDGQLAQYIAAGNGRRWTHFPTYYRGQCLSIDIIISLLLPQQIVAAKFPILLSPTISIDRHVQQSIVPDNVYR